MTYPNNANTYLPGVIFIPSALLITAVTQANPMVVTFSIPSTGYNSYQPQMLVKFNIPYSYGMQQLNGLTLPIQSIDDTNDTMTFAIDSTYFDPFSIPASGEMPASLSPSGSRNLQFNNTTNLVPFQPLNNVGN